METETESLFIPSLLWEGGLKLKPNAFSAGQIKSFTLVAALRLCLLALIV